MGSPPEYRAALCRLTLTRIRAEADAASILDRISEDSLAAIERAHSLAWVDAGPLDALNGALLAVRGPDGYLEFWAHHSTVASASPLMGSLAEAAMRIFGRDNPRGLLKWIGRAWDLTSRNLGSVITEENETSVLIVQQGIPVSHRMATVSLSMHGSIVGLVRSTGHVPDVDADTTAFGSEGVARYTVRWSSAG